MTLGVRKEDSAVDCKDLVLRVPPFEGFRGLSTGIFPGFHGWKRGIHGWKRGFHGWKFKRIGL